MQAVRDSRINKLIAIGALIVVLSLVNWKIAAKEKHLADGRIVLLELAPVDPRSLMQGDYMTLRFSLTRDIRNSIKEQLASTESSSSSSSQLKFSDGFVAVKVDADGKGSFVEIKHGTTQIPLPVPVESNSESSILWLHYRVRAGQVKFATNAFFFQEGHGEKYDVANYGMFRVNEHGDLLLTGLCTDSDNCLNALP